jgi:hypothetical protein
MILDSINKNLISPSTDLIYTEFLEKKVFELIIKDQ